MNSLEQPIAEAKSLSEMNAGGDIDQMLNDYVKPAFLKMSPSQIQQTIDYIKKLTEDGETV